MFHKKGKREKTSRSLVKNVALFLTLQEADFFICTSEGKVIFVVYLFFDFNNVHTLRKKGETRSSGFRLDIFKYRKEK